jgi:hypothetical protein
VDRPVSNIRYTHENAFVGCFGVAVRTDCDSEIGAFEGNPSPNMTTVSYCAERPGGGGGGGRGGVVNPPPWKSFSLRLRQTLGVSCKGVGIDREQHTLRSPKARNDSWLVPFRFPFYHTRPTARLPLGVVNSCKLLFATTYRTRSPSYARTRTEAISRLFPIPQESIGAFITVGR